MNRRRALATLASLGACATTWTGCSLGPRSVERDRLRYNEAVKTTTEQQLLLNIVRLRYIDTPSSLAITNIAEQRELVAGLKAIPFFTSAGAGDVPLFRGSVLPEGELQSVNRPTLSYTPLDDQEFTRRLFTPISLEGAVYIAKTTWPISTVFRLYLENLNWVSNAETASGPTPRTAPDYQDFRAGVDALQRLQDRRLATLYHENRSEFLSDGMAESEGTAAAAVESAKNGLEYRRRPDGTWAIVKPRRQPVLRVGAVSLDDGDWLTFCRVFRLDPEERTFEITSDQLDPFYIDAPATGLRQLDLETRSLLQVLFFLSHGVEPPAAHLAAGVAPDTEGFAWSEVLGDLFVARATTGRAPPPGAHVSVCYRGHWFSIDDRDRDSKSTFALLVELSRLELAAPSGSGPILTLPLGGGS